jgi:hypothetical protein
MVDAEEYQKLLEPSKKLEKAWDNIQIKECVVFVIN